MPTVKFPYGKTFLELEIPENRYAGTLVPKIHKYHPDKTQEELVKEALEHPIGTPRLREMAKGKKNIVIIASDHTRPVPSKVIIPLMLAEIRKGNPQAEITLLISTGCHRNTTKEELMFKFGPEIAENEKIVIHDCDNQEMLVDLGVLPSGGRLLVNKLAVQADLLLAEGLIEPHYFAGFSGGRKSVLPGVSARETVLYNHNAAFIDSPYARTGILKNNPVHNDMLYAARAAHLAFICNVVINAQKEVIYAAAGDMNLAHQQGCGFLADHSMVKCEPSYIAVSTNGGYPLDQNVYQSLKGMSSAAAVVKPGGVIIMISQCVDGHGSEIFYNTFKNTKDLNPMMAEIRATPAEETTVDQWQAQIFGRMLLHASVVFVSDLPDAMIEDFHMIPAHSLPEALEKADHILEQKGIQKAKITAIPDGVSVIVES